MFPSPPPIDESTQTEILKKPPKSSYKKIKRKDFDYIIYGRPLSYFKDICEIDFRIEKPRLNTSQTQTTFSNEVTKNVLNLADNSEEDYRKFQEKTLEDKEKISLFSFFTPSTSSITSTESLKIKEQNNLKKQDWDFSSQTLLLPTKLNKNLNKKFKIVNKPNAFQEINLNKSQIHTPFSKNVFYSAMDNSRKFKKKPSKNKEKASLFSFSTSSTSSSSKSSIISTESLKLKTLSNSDNFKKQDWDFSSQTLLLPLKKFKKPAEKINQPTLRKNQHSLKKTVNKTPKNLRKFTSAS